MRRTTPPLAARQPTPWHLWVVCILCLIWNGLGVYDLIMTITRGAPYLRSVGMEEPMIAWLQSAPSWIYVPWAVGVSGALVATLYLSIRRKAAVEAYAFAFAGIVASTLVQKTGLAGGVPEATGNMVFMPYVIIAVAIAQWFYASRMAKRSVLI